jgi:hypothetical protein
VLLLTAVVPSVARQRDAAAPGPIARLTAETREEALACGRKGRDCAVTPYELCQDIAEYTIRLITPFSRVAEASLDAEEGRRPVGRIGPATVNRWGIGLSVLPASRVSSPASIGQVTIQREGQTVRPVNATVGLMAVATPDGAVLMLNRGFFVFPVDAFEPSTDVTLVFTGSSGDVFCSLDRRQLSALR